MKRCSFFIYFILVLASLHAQKKNINYTYFIHKAIDPISVDGISKELSWKNAQVASKFKMVLPMDTSLTNVATEVRMTYDQNNLYLLVDCFKIKGAVNMIESLKRDWNFVRNDNFVVFMDTYGDLTNGFAFGTNAAGALWDGTMSDGGLVDLNWDNKWIAIVENDSSKFTWEAAIPFKSIRYKTGIKEWGINFSRNDLRSTEKSAWAPVPRQFPTASLSYTGSLVWDTILPRQKNNFSFIPYFKTGIGKEFTGATGVKTNLPATYEKYVGVDAKISLSSSLNLDLTTNPDFSQVEVDKQVTNLSRFELFFPERRQFFLENADLFSNLGFANVRPFFSRRIGLNAPIDFGARLSGSIDKNWRIGLLDMKTGMNNSSAIDAQNFSVLALKRRLFKKSSIELFYIDKTSLEKNNTYNKNFGFEYILAPTNNTWSGKTIFIQSVNPQKVGDGLTNATFLQYSSRQWIVSWQHEIVGNNFNAEVGFIPRNNYFKINPSITHLFFPKKGAVLSHAIQASSALYFNAQTGHSTDFTTSFNHLITLRNKSTFSSVFQHDFVELLTPFDPTRIGKVPLAAFTKHEWNTVGFDIVSAPQHLLTFSLSTRLGGYYADGNLLSFSGSVGYRIQPFVNIDFSTTYNKISLPMPWGNNHFLLIGPKVDFTMTNTLFLTNYFQYNEQTKNINFNARLQWRYKPVSDLFIVYTDNYYIGPVFVKNRAVVLKLTYWFNK